MRRTLKLLLPSAFLFFLTPSWAEEYSWNKDGQATLSQFLEYVTQKTGKNFIYNPAILEGKKVTILAPNFRPENLLSIFETALEMQGLGLAQTEDGQTFKILQVERLKAQPLPIFTEDNLKDLPTSDRLVTQIITMKHIDPAMLGPILNDLMHIPTGSIRPIPNTRVVVITEYASNMPRLMKIVEMMDREPASRVVIAVSLRPILTGSNLKAEDVLTAVEAGLSLGQEGDKGETKPMLKFHPDSMLLFIKGSKAQVDLALQAILEIQKGLGLDKAANANPVDPKQEKK